MSMVCPPMPSRAEFLLLVFLPGALGGCGPSAPPRAVVLVTCDTLRADRLGCYGYERETSPNLDALAREALVFEAAWSTAPLTGPALSALLTGRMPEELGLSDNRNVLSGAATTLAERLSAAGIDTAAVVSNWVLRKRADLPEAGVQQGFAAFDDRMTAREPARPDLKERLAPDTTDAALAWLDAHDARRPFFLWVHYQDPHGPYTPPADCLAALARAPTDEPELAVGPDEKGRGALPKYQVVDAERRPEVYRARYDAEIRFFDREFGRLLEGLRARGVLDSALLVFTADHGESLGERGYYFSHGQHLHRELVQVPLVVRAPGGVRAPGRMAAPASHLDLFPTTLAFFGLDSGPTRGRDLLAGALPAERVVPQFLRGAWSASGAHERVLLEDGALRLYDLARDPHEEHDLAAEQPARAQELAAAHRSFAATPAFAPIPAAQPAHDAQAENELDALGYGGRETKPTLEALVVSVDEGLRLVVLDKGQKDGVARAAVFDVYRGSQRKGRIQIQSVQDGASTGLILNEEVAISAGDSARLSAGDRDH
ncbi:MAG: hypothetical protein EXS08_03640 [Planctomycetes bacterium]|nr:hypothetical protein [Planctomycetota bacterium]